MIRSACPCGSSDFALEECGNTHNDEWEDELYFLITCNACEKEGEMRIPNFLAYVMNNARFSWWENYEEDDSQKLHQIWGEPIDEKV